MSIAMLLMIDDNGLFAKAVDEHCVSCKSKRTLFEEIEMRLASETSLKSSKSRLAFPFSTLSSSSFFFSG